MQHFFLSRVMVMHIAIKFKIIVEQDREGIFIKVIFVHEKQNM